MAILRFSPAVANSVYLDGLSTTTPGTIAKSINSPNIANTVIFGSVTAQPTESFMYIFKGTMPSNFSTFSTIDSRSSDLIAVLPLSGAVNATSASPTSYRIRGATRSYSNTTFGTGVWGWNYSGTHIVSRTSNTGTLTLSGAGTSYQGVVPGTSFTLANVSNSELDGTYIVSTRNSANVITFSSSGGNIANINLTATQIFFPFKPSSNGTASWFCLCRTPNTFLGNTSLLTSVGAVMGNIGNIGSGSDLELASTSLTTDNYIISAGMYFNFPYDWTV